MLVETVFKNGRRRQEVGQVDEHTVSKAQELGMDIAAGTVNKTSGRVTVLKSVRNLYPGKSHLRSHVVWWLNTGEIIDGEDVHHKNTNRIDDRFGNLEWLDHVEHAHHHNIKGLRAVERACLGCGKSFKIDGWRLKDVSRGKFCSQECYHNQERSIQHKQAIGRGLVRAYAEGRR